jgi:hypothetical protein
MKKISIFLGAVFCIFILCSITYQPIVANESLRIKNKNNDCGCYKKVSKLGWPFPIICTLLTIMFRILTRIASVIIKITGDQPSDSFINMLNMVINGLDTFNCDFK